MVTDSRLGSRYFYGLQPSWFSSNRLYRIYVTPQMLAGAYVAGQAYDDESAGQQLGGGMLLLWPFVRRWLQHRQEREAFYDTLDPSSAQFLEHDSRNFQFRRADVVSIRLHRKHSLWTPVNFGKIEVKLIDGSIRHFILVGDQQTNQILDLIRTFDSGIAVVENRKCLPLPVGETEARDWSSFWGRHRYRVDNAGVWQYDRLGLPTAFIAWADLERADSGKLRSRHGVTIRPPMNKYLARSLLRSLNVAWHERCPDAQGANEERNRRIAIRALYTIPALPAILLLACYAFYWWHGCPPAAAKDVKVLHRLAILNGFLALSCGLFHYFFFRPHRQTVSDAK